MASLLIEKAWDPVRFVVNPSAVIQANEETYSGNVVRRARIALKLSVFYASNLLLYTVPLTLGGRGTVQGAAPPAFLAVAGVFTANPVELWMFLNRLVQNSAFLFVGSGLVLVTYHPPLVVTRSSEGFLQSLHSVIYSTGVYMAAIFTLVWYAGTARGIEVADDFLIFVQTRFFYFFFDLTNQPLELPGGRAEPVVTADMTLLGQLTVAALIVSILYFLYSLYLGARINHGAGRLDGFLATAFVALSPVLYVLGLIYFTVLTGGV